MKNFDSLPMFLTEDTLVDFWKQYFQEHPQTRKQDIQLYIHYPWCRQICKFCVFGQCKYSEYKDIIAGYEIAMIRQLEKMNDVFFNTARPTSIYFGGGTASLWTPNALLTIADTIYCYDTVGFKEAELHPADIGSPTFYAYLDLMRFDRVSIGVQSFDMKANHDQNRIRANINDVRYAVGEFRKRDILTNIDLVALFNGESQYDWDLFKEDLGFTADIVKPDSIFAEPNFKSNDFYRNSIKFRKILKEFLDNHPEYSITNKDALSTDYNNIIQYRDLPYELMHTSIVPSQISTSDFIDQRKDEIIIGLGGINDFTAYSKTPDGFYINAKYIPHDKEFVYTLTRHNKFQGIDSTDENDLYNTRVQVGSYTIAPPRRISE